MDLQHDERFKALLMHGGSNRSESAVKHQPTNGKWEHKWEWFSFEKVTGRPRQSHKHVGTVLLLEKQLSITYGPKWVKLTRISHRHLWGFIPKHEYCPLLCSFNVSNCMPIKGLTDYCCRLFGRHKIIDFWLKNCMHWRKCWENE